jgi:hypothetical protein
MLQTRNILNATGFTDRDCEVVSSWWESSRLDQESMPSTFARHGIFRSTAERTLELMKKGFVSGIQASTFFEQDGIDRLRETINEYQLTANSPKTAPIRVQASRKKPSITSSKLDFGQRSVNVRDTLADQMTMTQTTANLPVVGETLGRCLITGVLGKGGFGTVFSALHTTLNIPVAIKVLCNKTRLTDNIRDLLRREAQVLARMNHSSIVRVLDFDDSHSPYFIMEMVDGPSLLDLLQQAGTFNEKRVIDIMIQVAGGLAEAWKHKIVHRDIKPGNILVTKTGDAKLADLGLAKMPGLEDASLSPDRNRPIGTCAYIAPEQIKSCDKLDFRADIYSLGCTMYHILTGKIPFDGKSQREVIMKHMMNEPESPSAIAPNQVSEDLSQIILTMMQKKPEDRFQSYDELITALKSLRSSNPMSQPTQSNLSLSSQSGFKTKDGKNSRLLRWFGLRK